MFLCFCSTATRSWKGIGILFLLVAVAQSFQSAVVPQQHHLTSTALNAIAIPHDSSAWIAPLDGKGSAAPSRTKRINLVLEKARSRTGLANANSGKATKTRTNQVGEAYAVVLSPSSSISLDTESSIDTVLPFELPKLSDLQMDRLMAGEIIQEQSEMGRQGSGFVVQDVQANEKSVWDVLLDFEAYVESIHTVRSMKMIETTSTQRRYNMPSTTRASFSVSRFQLTIGAILQYFPHKCGHYMELYLDNALSNAALQQAKGIWYTEVISPTVTRVWLLCDLTISPLLPPFIVDCAATKAMPRASSWIRPAVALRQSNQS